MMIWTCAPIYAFLVAGFGIGGEPQDSGVPPYVPVQQAKQQPAKESKRFFLFDRKKNSNHRTESAPRNNAETPIDAIRVTNIESASIPTHLFSGQFKDRAMQILRKPQFHRTGPEETIACDPGLYEWLLDHPIQVAEFWRQAGIDVGSVEEIEGGYFCKDAENGSCKFYTVYSSPEMRVAYCIGESKSSLVPFTLRAEMVLVQRYRFERYSDGKFRLV